MEIDKAIRISVPFLLIGSYGALAFENDLEAKRRLEEENKPPKIGVSSGVYPNAPLVHKVRAPIPTLPAGYNSDPWMGKPGARVEVSMDCSDGVIDLNIKAPSIDPAPSGLWFQVSRISDRESKITAFYQSPDDPVSGKTFRGEVTSMLGEPTLALLDRLGYKVDVWRGTFMKGRLSLTSWEAGTRFAGKNCRPPKSR